MRIIESFVEKSEPKGESRMEIAAKTKCFPLAFAVFILTLWCMRSINRIRLLSTPDSSAIWRSAFGALAFANERRPIRCEDFVHQINVIDKWKLKRTKKAYHYLPRSA